MTSPCSMVVCDPHFITNQPSSINSIPVSLMFKTASQIIFKKKLENVKILSYLIKSSIDGSASNPIIAGWNPLGKFTKTPPVTRRFEVAKLRCQPSKAKPELSQIRILRLSHSATQPPPNPAPPLTPNLKVTSRTEPLSHSTRVAEVKFSPTRTKNRAKSRTEAPKFGEQKYGCVWK